MLDLASQRIDTLHGLLLLLRTPVAGDSKGGNIYTWFLVDNTKVLFMLSTACMSQADG